MQNKLLFCLLLVTPIAGVFAFNILTSNSSLLGNLTASVFFIDSIETKDVREKYKGAINEEGEPVSVLIVPGHDNNNTGAVFGAYKEADLNVSVGTRLHRLITEEEGVESFLLRDGGGYHKEFSKYLEENKEEIDEFVSEKKRIMYELIAEGKVESYVNVHHNFARPEVVDILYGVNKFANDHEYDMIIHIHFNDYPGRTGSWGKYSGYAIYVPERQYSNAKASKKFATFLDRQFSQVFAETNLPKEDAITEDQELIGIGAYNTADPISVLIEYGYIYESHFTDPQIRNEIYDDLAIQTFYGIKNYLGNEKVTKETFGSFTPTGIPTSLRKGDGGISVLMLQDALRDVGYYPYRDSLNNCPLNGNFRDCTYRALIRFQDQFNLEPNGIFTEETKEVLVSEWELRN